LFARDADDHCVLSQWTGGQTKQELAVVLISGVAHDLMEAGGVQVAQQATENVRMMQSVLPAK